MRDVRVAVEGDPVRRSFDDLVQRRAEAAHRLARQAINQVDVERAKAPCASGIDDHPRFGFALKAIHGPLNFGIEVLDAKAHAVETELRARATPRCRASPCADRSRSSI